MTRNLYLGADLAPAIDAKTSEAFVAATGQILREVDRQRFPDPGQGPGRGDPQQEARPGRPAGGRPLAHRRRPASDRSSRQARARPRSATTTCRNCWTSSTRARTQYEVVVVQPEFDLEAPGRRERVPGRPAASGSQRRDQRPPDDARRDPRPAQCRRADLEPAVGQFQNPAAGADPRPAADDQTGLDGDRRQGARQPAVPLRQHPSGGVRPGGAGAEHPLAAGG